MNELNKDNCLVLSLRACKSGAIENRHAELIMMAHHQNGNVALKIGDIGVEER